MLKLKREKRSRFKVERLFTQQRLPCFGVKGIRPPCHLGREQEQEQEEQERTRGLSLHCWRFHLHLDLGKEDKSYAQ
jgi:hypothetical protein